MNTKLIALGVVAVVATWLIGHQIFGLLNLPLSPTAIAVLSAAIGGGLGAYIAKRNFMLPALVALALCWSAAVFVLYQIAAPVGQASVRELLIFNAISISLSVVALVAGVLAGSALANRQLHTKAAT